MRRGQDPHEVGLRRRLPRRRGDALLAGDRNVAQGDTSRPRARGVVLRHDVPLEYFSQVAGAERTANGGADPPKNVQAFQYFPSVEYLRDLLMDAGFEESKVSVELLGRACVIMLCEK